MAMGSWLMKTKHTYCNIQHCKSTFYNSSPTKKLYLINIYFALCIADYFNVRWTSLGDLLNFCIRRVTSMSPGTMDITICYQLLVFIFVSMKSHASTIVNIFSYRCSGNSCYCCYGNIARPLWKTRGHVCMIEQSYIKS